MPGWIRYRLRSFVAVVFRRHNPEARLEAEKTTLRRQIGRANQDLASHASVCERLLVRVRELEAQENRLRTEALSFLEDGARQAAGRNALRLRSMRRELGSYREQLTLAKTTYRHLLKQRDAALKQAHHKLEKLRRGIEELRFHKAMAELTEEAAASVDSLSDSYPALDKLDASVTAERLDARARMHVTSAMAADSEMTQAEKQALEEFLANEPELSE